MNAAIRITTGCRLHFGLLSTNRAQDRCFGGLGVMLASPGWSLRLEEVALADEQPVVFQDVVVAAGETRERIERLISQLRVTEVFRGRQAIRVTVEWTLSHHAGLGSGTQLAMALTEGWGELLGKTFEPQELFAISGRGARSSVGQYGYLTGGFLVDAGHHCEQADAAAAIVVRADFPEEWGWWLISPKNVMGLSGEAELKAFREMSPIPQAMTDRLAALTLLSILPGLKSRSFGEFATGLHEYGRLVGEHFAAVQGSVFSSPLMGDLAKHLMGAGLPCVVQSSWGPTVAVPVTTEIEEEFEAAWKKWPPHEKCDRLRTKAMNHRAVIRR
ncbi:beta-ribofuranosylaminobenzene 5'-phosphate synthase family protein [Planctopirus hydrillae]|uniref:GHMP kinase N-terminal domain-containing protein n=1 Tax=Planctopirus hydrillae TaxID=1841610 RepID=A0A1C3EQF3_9PLAN|nr:beta-ribofuranosylaminobenzene 5'-phosphate synthase family protein [Planctopirus hydrillae]ODA35429.1 hypothetical protein A6X21_16555 [Planctopirus hydrillae]